MRSRCCSSFDPAMIADVVGEEGRAAVAAVVGGDGVCMLFHMQTPGRAWNNALPLVAREHLCPFVGDAHVAGARCPDGA